MEASTSDERPTDSLRILEAQIREVFGRCVYSHKTHEKCADQYLAMNQWIKIIQMGLSAGTTTSLLLALFGDTHLATAIGAALSTLLLILTAYTKDFDPGQNSQRHSDTATRLWAIREAYFSLLTDLACGLISTEGIVKRRDQLQESLEGIHTGAPRTNSRAYKAAQEALQIKEELTFSDQEIDNFLPVALRRGSPKSTTNGKDRVATGWLSRLFRKR